jgi:hypothetical protein
VVPPAARRRKVLDRGLYIERRLDGRSLLLDGVGDGHVTGKFLAVLHAGRNTPALSLKRP